MSEYEYEQQRLRIFHTALNLGVKIVFADAAKAEWAKTDANLRIKR